MTIPNSGPDAATGSRCHQQTAGGNDPGEEGHQPGGQGHHGEVRGAQPPGSKNKGLPE